MFIRGPIKGMATSRGPFLDPSKLIDLILLGSLWMHEALGDMLALCQILTLGNGLGPEI